MGAEGLKARIAERKRHALDEWTRVKSMAEAPEIPALFTPLAPPFSYADTLRRDRELAEDGNLSRARINAILTALKDAPESPRETVAAGPLSPTPLPVSAELAQSSKDSKILA